MNKKPRVLIIDDQPSARQVIQDHLWKEDYELIPLASGQEALAHMDEWAPDVILLDVMMPELDGFEVCRRIKADPRWQHIPVILLTALGGKDNLAQGFDSGAEDFVSKPVNGLELRARVRSMLRIKRQHDDLQAALHLREDLADMLVHDMRSPLSTILLYASLLQKTHATPKGATQVKSVLAAARRLESFINELLIVAKARDNKMVLNRQWIDVNPLILSARARHTASAQQQDVQLVADLPATDWQLWLDQNLFDRVLDNLISNALKFAPPGSTVTLRAEPLGQTDAKRALPEASGRIQVLDQGPGIPKAHRQVIFDKFQVARLRKDKVTQIGLGLTFCKMVVQAHGGRIQVAANTPQGSIFTVEI